jgi:hypothetical protein
VKVFDGATGALTASFLAYAPGFKGGVRVAVGDVDGDGKLDVITGPGKNGGALVEGFDGRTLTGLDFFFASSNARPGGVFVAGSR